MKKEIIPYYRDEQNKFCESDWLDDIAIYIWPEDELNRVLRIARSVILERIENPDLRQVWEIFNSGISTHEATFKNVLPKNGIQAFLSAKNKPTILDMMSYGQLAHELIDTGLVNRGLSVNDDPETQEKVPLQYKGRADNLYADLSDFIRTKEELKKWLHINKLNGFDLIINQGCGGLKSLPDDFRFHYQLLEIYWKFLKPGGMILTQSVFPVNILTGLVDFLKQNGIHAVCGMSVTQHKGLSFYSNVIRIDKGLSSVGRLPALKYKRVK